jgi:hypothetical protein
MVLVKIVDLLCGVIHAQSRVQIVALINYVIKQVNVRKVAPKDFGETNAINLAPDIVKFQAHVM